MLPIRADSLCGGVFLAKFYPFCEVPACHHRPPFSVNVEGLLPPASSGPSECFFFFDKLAGLSHRLWFPVPTALEIVVFPFFFFLSPPSWCGAVRLFGRALKGANWLFLGSFRCGLSHVFLRFFDP